MYFNVLLKQINQQKFRPQTENHKQPGKSMHDSRRSPFFRRRKPSGNRSFFFFAALCLCFLLSCSNDNSTGSDPTQSSEARTSSSDVPSSSGDPQSSSEGISSSSALSSSLGSSSGISSSVAPSSSSLSSSGVSSSAISSSSGASSSVISSPAESSSSLLSSSSGTSSSSSLSPFNSSVSYGELVDARDGKVYKTVVIDGHRIMAQNLDYGVMIPGSQDMNSGSADATDASQAEKYCYDDDPSNCALYGGLYQWSQAMALPASCNEGYCTAQIQSPHHRGICPEGWHMPTGSEWGFQIGAYTTLTLGRVLKSPGFWSGGAGNTNESGFSALPGGGTSWMALLYPYL